MSQYRRDIIFVDRLRTCLALAVFPASVKCIDKFYVYAINPRSVPDDLSQTGNENLHILTEACIDART